MSATKKRKIVAAAKEADAKEEKDLVSEADGKVEDELDEKEEKENLNSKDDPIPPVQTGNFTQDNDTRLKNPKSEYVEPQTLSASAIAELGLFSEENNGLETQGREYLKRNMELLHIQKETCRIYYLGKYQISIFPKINHQATRCSSLLSNPILNPILDRI